MSRDFRCVCAFALLTLVGLGFVACDKGTKPIPVPDKVWTMADCENYVRDTLNYSQIEPCDTVFYRDFINDCEWVGDSVPAKVNDFWQTGVNAKPILQNLKKLSSKIVRMGWWDGVLISGVMTELPKEIWMIPYVSDLSLDSLPNLRNIPEVPGTNRKIRELNISRAHLLDSLPHSLTLLRNLYALWLNDLTIQHLPAWLPEFDSLRYLVAHNNLLIDIPENIVDVPNLKDFRFDDNQVSVLPNGFCPNRFEYSLTGNKLCNLSDSLKTCMGWSSMWDSTQLCK